MPFFELRGFASFCPNLLYLPQVATKKPNPTQLQTREENAHASKHQTENHLSGGREQNQQQNLEQHESRSHQRQLADHRGKTEQLTEQDRQIRRTNRHHGDWQLIYFLSALPLPPLLRTFPLVVPFCQTNVCHRLDNCGNCPSRSRNKGKADTENLVTLLYAYVSSPT